MVFKLLHFYCMVGFSIFISTMDINRPFSSHVKGVFSGTKKASALYLLPWKAVLVAISLSFIAFSQLRLRFSCPVLELYKSSLLTHQVSSVFEF